MHLSLGTQIIIMYPLHVLQLLNIMHSCHPASDWVSCIVLSRTQLAPVREGEGLCILFYMADIDGMHVGA